MNSAQKRILSAVIGALIITAIYAAIIYFAGVIPALLVLAFTIVSGQLYMDGG